MEVLRLDLRSANCKSAITITLLTVVHYYSLKEYYLPSPFELSISIATESSFSSTTFLSINIRLLT